MLSCRFNFKAYAKDVTRKVTKCSLETAEVLLHAKEHIFIKEQELQIVLRATHTLDLLNFFPKRTFCLMPCLKLNLSSATSFLADNLSRVKKSYIQAYILYTIEFQRLKIPHS